MALQKTITLDSGVTIEDAYIKLCEVNYFNKVGEPNIVRLHVTIFKDRAYREANKPEVTKMYYTITGDDYINFFSLSILSQESKNIINQGYEFLKSLVFFADAIDIEDIKE